MTRLTGLVSQEHLDELGITYEDLAKTYFVEGRTNGVAGMWPRLKSILDQDQSKYDEYVKKLPQQKVLDYYSYEKRWEESLLTQEPEVDENKELIDELNSVIMKAQEQIEILTTKEEK